MILILISRNKLYKKILLTLFSTIFFLYILYNNLGDLMKVKIFDEEHEKDLETSINNFLSENDIEVIDIKFSTSTATFADEQIYCFTAMIIYY